MRNKKLYIIQTISVAVLTFSIAGLCNHYQARAEPTTEESGVYYNSEPITDMPLAGSEIVLAEIEPTPIPVDKLSCMETEPELDAPGDSLVSLGEFETTAYCGCEKCCGKWSEYGLTASGTEPQEGKTVAVDKDVIPLGTTLVINGEEYIAEDTGGAVKGNVIDIFFCSHDEALEYGRQKLEVFINN